MMQMSHVWNEFWSDESGQGLVEYALIIALVAVALVAALGLMKDELETTFGTITDELKAANGTAATTS